MSCWVCRLHGRIDRGQFRCRPQRYDDRGALLRFKKSHSPTTALAIIDAIHAFVRPDRVAGQYPNGGQ